MPGQWEIEIRKIDDDERVGPLRLCGRDQTPQRPPRSWNFEDGLGEAGNREAAIVVDEATARSRELRAAEALDLHPWIERAQR